MRLSIALCAALVLVVSFAAGARAQPLDADGERFRADVVRAYGAPTADRVRARLHPAFRRLMDMRLLD